MVTGRDTVQSPGTLTPWKSYGILAIVTALLIGQGLALGWEPVDDAYISFRYADNLVRGNGLVFNPGEHVEGYTNFLWTLMLAGAERLGADLPSAATWLGAALMCLSLGLTWSAARRVAAERGWPGWLAVVPPLLLVCYPGWAFWGFAGLEGPLLVCLVLGFLLLGARSRPSSLELVLTGLLGSLAAMTRWEVVLLWPVVLGARLLDTGRPAGRRSREAILVAILLAAGFGSYFAWRYHYYGELMPNTYYAKVGGSLTSRLVRGTVYTGELAITWLLPLSGLVWVIGLKQRFSLMLTVTLGIYTAYVTWTGGDFFPWLRFYLPVLPIAAIMATHLLCRLCAALEAHREARVLPYVLSIGVGIALAGIGLRLDYPAADYNMTGVRSWKVVGEWAAEQLPPGYRLVLAPIGAAAFYNTHPVIDLLGLTDYEVAHDGTTDVAEGPGHQRSNNPSILRRRPEVFLGHPELLRYPPTEEEVALRTPRKALQRLYATPAFQAMYRYRVAKIGDAYLPYWIRRDTPEGAAADQRRADVADETRAGMAEEGHEGVAEDQRRAGAAEERHEGAAEERRAGVAPGEAVPSAVVLHR